MTNEEIRARIVEIERILFAPANYTVGVLRDGTDTQFERLKRHVALGQERERLLGKLPPTGMASGGRVMIGQLLGTFRPEDWEREPEVEIKKSDWDWED